MCIVSSFTHLKMFKFRNFPIRWDIWNVWCEISAPEPIHWTEAAHEFILIDFSMFSFRPLNSLIESFHFEFDLSVSYETWLFCIIFHTFAFHPFTLMGASIASILSIVRYPFSIHHRHRQNDFRSPRLSALFPLSIFRFTHVSLFTDRMEKSHGNKFDFFLSPARALGCRFSFFFSFNQNDAHLHKSRFRRRRPRNKQHTHSRNQDFDPLAPLHNWFYLLSLWNQKRMFLVSVFVMPRWFEWYANGFFII